MATVLSVKDLSTRHGGGLKLAGVSLEVAEGELVCILGANGAGKTSLLNTIAGVHRPMLGAIEFLGRDIGGVPAHRVAQRGLVLAPQNHPVFESLTVLECLTMQAARGLDEIFALFPNLAAKRRQRAGRLSGGERQMLSMAQSLMLRPTLCLLDEPSSGLAPMIVHEVFAAIRKLVAQGLTVLMVEQNATAALKLAHRAYVMEHGRITLEGDAASVAADDHVRKAYLGL
jgi:branched-chain amino acid transport system ATP-binding protein